MESPDRRLRIVAVNAITIAQLLLAMAAAALLLRGELALTAWLIFTCGFIDAFDGALARRLGVTSAFGEQLDALVDVSASTFVSALLALAWMGASAQPLSVLACGAYLVAGALRLARFNTGGRSSEAFIGFASPWAATLIAFTYLAFPGLPPLAVGAAVVVLAALMVSTIEYPKIPVLLRRAPRWVPPAALVCLAVSFVYTAWGIGTLVACLGLARHLRRALRRPAQVAAESH